jgi:A/G-specific adenine glycosylase
MELGATTCTARSWACVTCPLAASCAWAGGSAVDPAIGSAGVSGGQSRFTGSDRQGRGRLVDALRTGRVHAASLAKVMGWPDEKARAERVVATLLADGLVLLEDGVYRLP